MVDFIIGCIEVNILKESHQYIFLQAAQILPIIFVAKNIFEL